MPIPVHIVGGFLGTGKTTLIRDQLEARPGEQLAVIVNDFGEAGLDEARLAADAPFEIQNIPGGCVCCTAPEGFVDAVGALLERKPDRLLIEPTGLARPQDLVDTLRRCPHAGQLELAPLVVLVDPARLDDPGEAEGELVAAQAGAADVLVANRTDLCDADALARFDAWAAELWPGPLAVHHTTHGRIPAELMEWPEDEGPRLERSSAVVEHVHDHGGGDGHAEGFVARSWRWSPERWFDRERLERALLRASQGLAGAPLARFKGIFRTREGFLELDVAGGTPHAARSLHRRDSRADAIFEGAEDAVLERMQSWLESAALSDDELQAQARQIELMLPDGRVRILDREALRELPDGVPDVSTLFPKRSGAAARIESLWRQLALPEKGEAVICAADGFASEPVPVHALRQGVLLHSFEDGALPPKQGGPFRLLIPEDVADAPSGCANVKAVTRIVVRDVAAP